jgi:hypothetical protein
MDKDKETEEKKLRDLTPEKDAKGGSGGPQPLPPVYPDPRGAKPPTHQPPIDPPIKVG